MYLIFAWSGLGIHDMRGNIFSLQPVSYFYEFWNRLFFITRRTMMSWLWACASTIRYTWLGRQFFLSVCNLSDKWDAHSHKSLLTSLFFSHLLQKWEEMQNWKLKLCIEICNCLPKHSICKKCMFFIFKSNFWNILIWNYRYKLWIVSIEALPSILRFKW